MDLHDKGLFKLLKNCLPGPYTFILRASAELPKMVYAGGKKSWKRKEIGIRIPSDPVCQGVLEQLEEPLLCSTVPTVEGEQMVCHSPADNSDADWCREVDVVIEAGERPVDGSTIYDFTSGELELLREGLGPILE